MLPNVGFGELMLVLVIGLLVVGPQRLPEITRAAAKAWRTFQQETGKAKAALKEVLEEPAAEFREAFAEPQAEIRRSIEETRSIAGVIDRPDGMPAPVRDPHARPIPGAAPAGGVAAAGAVPPSSGYARQVHEIPPPEPSPEELAARTPDEPLPPVVRDYEDT